METKIAPSRLRDMRFPKSDEKPNSEVRTYTLSPDELEKYRSLPIEQLKKPVGIRHQNEQQREQAIQSAAKRAENLRIEREKEMADTQENVQSKDQTIEKLTKEVYLALKEQGLSHVDIAKRFGIRDATVYYYLKKWGLHPQPKQEAIQEIAIEKPDDVEAEVKSEPIPAEENHHETKLNAIIHLPGCFEQIGKDIGALVDEKNAAYGNSFAKSGEFLKILYPDGLQPEQYLDALLLVRIFDKQMRIANKKNAFGESPYHDIAGYGILGASR